MSIRFGSATGRRAGPTDIGGRVPRDFGADTGTVEARGFGSGTGRNPRNGSEEIRTFRGDSDTRILGRTRRFGQEGRGDSDTRALGPHGSRGFGHTRSCGRGDSDTRILGDSDTRIFVAHRVGHLPKRYRSDIAQSRRADGLRSVAGERASAACRLASPECFLTAGMADWRLDTFGRALIVDRGPADATHWHQAGRGDSRNCRFRSASHCRSAGAVPNARWRLLSTLVRANQRRTPSGGSVAAVSASAMARTSAM